MGVAFDIEPNPFNAACQLRVDSQTGGKLEIFDITGGIMATFVYGQGSGELSWKSDNKACAVYLVHAINDDGQTMCRRVVYLK